MEVISNVVDALHNTSTIAFAITSVTLLIVILGYFIVRDNGVPPGPTGVPFLGYWPFLKSEIGHLQQLEMKKKYGDIFSFRVTGKLYINLASVKILREAHITRSDCFSERTMDFNLLGKIFESGVVFSNGDKWQTVRKFFLQQFRERGMTLYKENTSEAMYENIAVLIEELKQKAGKPLDILRTIVNRSNHVIRQTLFGPHTPITERDVQFLLGDYKIVMSLVHSSNLVLIGNIARYFIMPFLPNFKKGFKVHSEVKNFLLNLIENHESTFDGDNVRDIIDSYIKERNFRRSNGDPTAEYFTDETLAANLLQFVGDAIMNGSLFVSFFLKTLLDNPEEQEKIYQELMEVCGEDRNPSFEDRSKLTYTNAFLLEVQRTVSFVPIFPSLQCTKETTVGGYRIPKGAITLTNVYAIHNDSAIYENPEKFDPSRFMTKGIEKPESPITFGIGKRVCLGESFVMMQTFLYVTAIVKNFRLSYARPKEYFQIFKDREFEINITPRK